MALHGKTMGPFRESFCSRKRCMRLQRCCDVMTFESSTLTPFCMELLGVRKWIFQCLSGVFSAILVGNRLNLQEKVHFLYLYFFCRYSLGFFSPGRDQLLGKAGQENMGPCISPRISPLHKFWMAGLDSSI